MLYFLSRNDSMEMELTSGILRRARYTDSEMASGNNTVWASSSWHASPRPVSVCSDKSSTAKALQASTVRSRTVRLRTARITTLKDRSPNPAQSRQFPQR